MIVLGIETSCDETAAALVRADRTILAERIAGQVADHAPYGGVVPEIAARAHLQKLDGTIADTLRAAGLGFADLAGVAATGGPGLIGGVIVGTMTAKAIALVHGLPYVAVNHLEGHALSPRLSHGVPFPYLLLLVSGGHCQVLVVEGVGRHRLLGATLDDAAGEAFDKVAKLMGLGFPGGPAVEKLAAAGAPGRFPLPRPLLGKPSCDFSFAGLKTAVRQHWQSIAAPTLGDRADLARDFQDALVAVVADRVARAAAEFRRRWPQGVHLVAAGGVAANGALRAALTRIAADRGLAFVAPPPALCTDNAAMIAWAGIERLQAGLVDTLDFAPRPRWPLHAPAERAA